MKLTTQASKNIFIYLFIYLFILVTYPDRSLAVGDDNRPTLGFLKFWENSVSSGATSIPEGQMRLSPFLFFAFSSLSLSLPFSLSSPLLPLSLSLSLTQPFHNPVIL